MTIRVQAATCVKLMSFLMTMALCLSLGLSCSDSRTNGTTEDTTILDIATDTLGPVDTTVPPADTFAPDTWQVDTLTPDTNPIDTAPSSDCTPGEGCFGEPCGSADDCLSGICTMHLGEKVCSKTCDEACPVGWNCTLVGSGGDGQYVCMSAFSHLCLPCESADGCLGDVPNACVQYEGGSSFCGGACDDDNPCPEGYSCENVQTVSGTETTQCVNTAGTCECSTLAIASALSTPCVLTNEHGTCEGTRSCSEEGLSPCSATIPAADICNGIDDNCDGSTDEVPCDDNNPCTKDTCGGEAGCSSVPDVGIPCDDGDDQTTQDTCTEEGLCQGTPILCPTNPCIASSVPNGDDCINTYSEAGTACEDDDLTTSADVCDGMGNCKGTPIECPEASACITGYTTDGIGCVPVYADKDTLCDDAQMNTQNDVCDGAGGCAGLPYTCPEPTACTTGYTQDGKDCIGVYAEPGTTCDDGDGDTQADTCDGIGGCKGTPFGCPATTACTPGYSKDGDGCVAEYADSGTPCTDGDITTQNDVCDGAGACQGTTYECPEPTACISGYTQDGSGCIAQYADTGTVCNDENNATKDDVCNGEGICAGTAYECPAPSVCVPSVTQDGASCISNYADSKTTCNDGDPTTQNDLCDGAGGCSGTTYECPEPTTCIPSHTQDGTGCVANYAPNGTDCNDGNNATEKDICDGAGTCQGTVYECPAPSICIPSYAQDGETCIPSYADTKTTCNDGVAATKNDLCDGSGGCAGENYECPAPTTCIPSHTQDGIGCVANLADVGTACNDNNPGTIEDVCNAEGLCEGVPFGCPEASICTPSYTPNNGECIPNHADVGTACNDGKVDTANDVCSGFGVCEGTPYTCQAPTTCTPSYTQDGTDCIANYADSGTGCDDNNNNTQNDTCNGKGVCAGQEYSCPQPTACTPSHTKDGDTCIPIYADSGTDCDDGNNKTQNDTCNGKGICEGQGYSCPQPTACTPSHTQDGDTCIPNYADSGTDCNDGDNNTQNDTCNGKGICAGQEYSCPPTDTCTPSYTKDGDTCVPNYANSGTDCDDGNNKTQNDTCNGKGICAGQGYSCPQPTACTPSHTQDGDTCIPNYANSGTGCDDNNNNTQNDTCNGKGVCAGQEYSCPQPTACTPSHTKDGITCIPNYANSGTGCNDNNNNTQNDTCNGKGGCAGQEYSCPQPTVCTPSHTKNGDTCIPNYASSNTGCNDNNNNTQNDTCNGKGVCAGQEYSCPQPTVCTPSHTKNGVTCIPNYANSNTGCNDNNNNTQNDTCNGKGVCSGQEYSCPPTSTCTPSYTKDGSGCKANHAGSWVSCNDNNNNTNNDTCNGSGTCVGQNYSCPPPSTCTPSYTKDGSSCKANHAGSWVSCNDYNNNTNNDSCNGSGTCVGQNYSCPPTSTCTPSYTKDGSGCKANHAGSWVSCNDYNNGTYNDTCNGSGSCSGLPCNASGSTSDEYGSYKTNMVLKFGNGDVTWNLALLSSTSVAIAIQIRSLYNSELGREPDQGGLNYWINSDYMVRCKSEPSCNPATAKYNVNAAAYNKTKEAILSVIWGKGGEGFKKPVTSLTHCEAKSQGL